MMTKTIILTDLLIKKMLINYEHQYVAVTFTMVDENLIQWESHLAYFWVTLPLEPNQYDFQLPVAYLPTLLQLQTDADQALTDRFLI